MNGKISNLFEVTGHLNETVKRLSRDVQSLNVMFQTKEPGIVLNREKDVQQKSLCSKNLPNPRLWNCLMKEMVYERMEDQLIGINGAHWMLYSKSMEYDYAYCHRFDALRTTAEIWYAKEAKYSWRRKTQSRRKRGW